MRIVNLTKETTENILENMLKRSPNNYGEYEARVAAILEEVKAKGDEAIFAYAKQFDHVELTKETFRVSEAEIREAYDLVDADLIAVIKKALVNIREYHANQKQNSWFNSTAQGTMLGQKVTHKTHHFAKTKRQSLFKFLRTDKRLQGRSVFCNNFSLRNSFINAFCDTFRQMEYLFYNTENFSACGQDLIYYFLCFVREICPSTFISFFILICNCFSLFKTFFIMICCF